MCSCAFSENTTESLIENVIYLQVFFSFSVKLTALKNFQPVLENWW